MIKKYTSSLVLVSILSTKSVACCGCAIVEVAMQGLSQGIKQALNGAIEEQKTSYENTVLKHNKDVLKNIKERIKELNYSSNIQAKNSMCIDEIIFETKKGVQLREINKEIKLNSK